MILAVDYRCELVISLGHELVVGAEGQIIGIKELPSWVWFSRPRYLIERNQPIRAKGAKGKSALWIGLPTSLLTDILRASSSHSACEQIEGFFDPRALKCSDKVHINIRSTILSQSFPPSKIAASRLQRLVPEMGGGPDPKPEHLLAVLPFAEPTVIFDKIRKKHPNIKFSYHNLASADTVWKGSKNVPKGECNNPRSLRHGSRVL